MIIQQQNKAYTEYKKIQFQNRKKLNGYSGLEQLEKVFETCQRHEEKELKRLMAIAEDLPAIDEYNSKADFLANEDWEDWLV